MAVNEREEIQNEMVKLSVMIDQTEREKKLRALYLKRAAELKKLNDAEKSYVVWVEHTNRTLAEIEAEIRKLA